MPIKHDLKACLAEQIMHHAAHPTSIDQGRHKTCGVTTIEVRTYTRTPSAAAKLVADIGLTGRFGTADGTTIAFDAKSLQPDFEAQGKYPQDGQRDEIAFRQRSDQRASRYIDWGIFHRIMGIDPQGNIVEKRSEVISGNSPVGVSAIDNDLHSFGLAVAAPRNHSEESMRGSKPTPIQTLIAMRRAHLANAHKDQDLSGQEEGIDIPRIETAGCHPQLLLSA